MSLLDLLEQQSLQLEPTDRSNPNPPLEIEPLASLQAPEVSVSPPAQTLSSPTRSTPARTSVKPQVQNLADPDMYSYWSAHESIETIPNYRASDSCSNCAYATWDSAMGEPSCRMYRVPIISSYICDEYLNPDELIEPDADETPEDYSELQPLIEKFSIQVTEPQLLSEVVKSLTVPTDQPDYALRALRGYLQAYKLKHNALPEDKV